MRILDFTSITEEQGKTAVFAFGRMNPPTIGHKKLADAVLAQAGDPYIFLSQSQKPQTDPLDFATKLKFAQKFFPGITVGNPEVKTVIQALTKLDQLGYDNIIYIAGSDRIADFTELLNQYNGQPDKKGNVAYKFNDIQVVSAGERDPDAEGAEGMSASKMRAAAAAGEFEAFASGTPDPKLAKPMYDAVRSGMGIAESTYSQRMLKVIETLQDLHRAKPLDEATTQYVLKQVATIREHLNNINEATLDLPDLETGDELMVGKFKNRKATIKDFKKDEHGQPVAVTNKGEQQIFKGRIKKLMPTAVAGDVATFKQQAHRKLTDKSLREIYKTISGKEMNMSEEVNEAKFKVGDKVLPSKSSKTVMTITGIERVMVNGKMATMVDGHNNKKQNMRRPMSTLVAVSEEVNEIFGKKSNRLSQLKGKKSSIIGSKVIDTWKEASYEGNLGFEEVFKFFADSSKKNPKLANMVQYLIDNDKTQEAWKIIQDYSGVKLKGQQFEDGKSETVIKGVRYTNPQFDVEWEEANRYPYLEKLGSEGWEELAKTGRAVRVTTDSVKKIGNTGADGSESLDDLEPEKVARLKQAMDSGTVEMPIVVKQPDGSLELIAGNTRLIGLISTQGEAQVWLVDASTLTEVTIDNKNGRGAVPNNQEVDYFGMRVNMKPSTFIALASKLGKDPEPEMIDYIKKGGAIGSPFLSINSDETGEKAEVTGHEGRNRMLAIMKAEGDVPVEVHLFFSGKVNRARHLTPELINVLKKQLISQDDNLVKGPLWEGVGRIVKGVNTTPDVGVNQTKIEAAKLNIKVDKDGRPPVLERGSIGVPLSSGLTVNIAPHRELKIKKSTMGRHNYENPRTKKSRKS